MAGPGAGSLRSPALRTRDRGLRHLGQRRSCPPRPARRGDPARPARSGRHPTLPPNLGLAHRPPPGRARRPGHPVQPPAHRTGLRGVRHAQPRWHPRADRHRNRPCRGRHRRRPHRRPPGGDLSGSAARRAIKTAARPALRGHRRHSPPPPRQRRRPAVRQPASAPACATTSANTPCATALESANPRGSITACPNIRSPGVHRDSSAAESVVGWSTTPAVCDRVARGHASPVDRGASTRTRPPTRAPAAPPPRALAHPTDQLLDGIDVPLPDRSAPTRVLRWRSRARPGPGRGGGSAANSSLNQSSGIERGIRFGGWADSAPPVRSSTVHRVVVLMRPAGTTRQVQRERVDQRAGPRVEMDVVDASQHRLAVRDGGRA